MELDYYGGKRMELERSLVFSYLKHIKKCKIIQTNWLPCINGWNIHSRKGDELIRLAKNYFRNKYRISIFEEIATLDDINKENVVDAFGISFNEDYTQKMYGVCSCIFKENTTLSKKYVLEKIFLTAIYFISCFNKIEGNIIFLCSSADLELIKNLAALYEDIKEVFSQVKCEFELNIYLNEQFNEEVIKKLNEFPIKDMEIGSDEEYLKYHRYFNHLNEQNNGEIVNRAYKEENHNHHNKKENNHNDEVFNEKKETNKIYNKTIEIEGIKIQEHDDSDDNVENEIVQENNIQQSQVQTGKLDVVIDEDVNDFTFNEENSNGDNYSNNYNNNTLKHTTSYYMNKHNVKTQFSVDSNSFNKILEERKKRIVKELLQSETSRNLNEKYADIKISELVKNELNRLFEEEKIPIGEIRKLQELDYSVKTFGIQYPVLREVNINKPLEEQRRDNTGTAIYYGFITTIYNRDYYICSAWSEEHRIKFLRYLSFFK